MTATGGLPDVLWQLVVKLRRRGIAIGIDDLTGLRRALQLGFGLRSRADLRELVVSLWAKSVPEASLVRAEFEQLEIGEFAVAAAGTGPAPDTGEGRAAPSPPDAATASVTTDPLETAPAGTHALTAFPALPRRLGERAVGYHLLPRYPVTEREIAQAWRRLRRPTRIGPPTELDEAATVRRRLETGVVTPPVVRPRRRNVARLVLLVDRLGSMTPYHGLVDHVVTAIRKQGLLADVAVWYFHDTPAVGADRTPLDRIGSELLPVLDPVLADIRPNEQGSVYRDPELLVPVPLATAVAPLGPDVGAAVISDAGAARARYDPVRLLETLAFARAVRGRRGRIVWLNPVPARRWGPSTAGRLARHVPMTGLDLVGMHRAVDVLRGHPAAPEQPL